MIKTESLGFSYNREKAFKFPDLSVNSGENLLVLGKSGIGKTTLLHLLAGILRPEEGMVLVKDQNLTALSTSKRDRFRGQNIGLIYQVPHFVQSLTLKENLLLVQYLAGEKQDVSRIQQVLDQLDIISEIDRKPQLMSQGQQQRASIAMAILNKPEVILADEPTSSLDDDNCKRVIDLLKEQSENLGSALIVITHDHRLKEEFQNSISL